MVQLRNKKTGQVIDMSTPEAQSMINSNDLAKRALDKILGKQEVNPVEALNRKVNEAVAIKRATMPLDIEEARQKDKPGKIPAAQLGYHTMAAASSDDYNFLKNEMNNKKITYDDLRMAYAKTPTDVTSKINTILYAAADAWLRIQTGAQANPSEIEREAAKYKPRPWDSDSAIEFKLKSLFENRLGRYQSAIEENSGIKKQQDKTQSDPLGLFK